MKLWSDSSIKFADQDSRRLELPSEASEMPLQISSRSDKGFRPVMNLTDEAYDERRKQTPRLKTKMKENPKPQNAQKNEQATGNENTSHNAGAGRSLYRNEKATTNRTRVSVESMKSSQNKTKTSSDKTAQKITKPNPKEQNMNSTSQRIRKETKTNGQTAPEKRKPRKKSTEEKQASIVDDFSDARELKSSDFSYKRSSTVTLQGTSDSASSSRVNESKLSNTSSRGADWVRMNQ